MSQALKIKKHFTKHILILVALTLVALVCNISLGSVAIPFKDTIQILMGFEHPNTSWHYIVLNYRFTKAITALCAGAGLSVAGLLMQSTFRNPLAGPYVLGVSSGAGLGVALVVMGATLLGSLGGFLITHAWGIAIAAFVGTLCVLLILLITSFRVSDNTTLLIIGLMFGSFASAIVSVLAYFTNSEMLQRYIFWSFGSLGHLTTSKLWVLIIISCLGFCGAIYKSKSLDAFVLGDAFAFSVGVKLKAHLLYVIILTSLLVGTITAFAGPIAFIGLAVPHVARQFIRTTNHFILIPATALCGAIILLLCDTIAQLPFSDYTLPINAITALFGAPLIIWILIRKQKLFF